MKEGSVLLVRTQESLVDRVGRERGGKREIAAGETFANAHEVGPHVLVLAREHRARAAKAGRHLVADQQGVVGPAQLANRP